MRHLSLWLAILALASFSSAACIRGEAGIQAVEKKYLFLFGDSYTKTDFQITGAKPSTKNPLGNPSWPGVTTSGGKNWVAHALTDRIASKYQNDTLTFNFAVGGSTVDRNITPSKPRSTVVEQVQLWDKNIKNRPSYAKWTASNAAVGIWIGINDIGSMYGKHNEHEVLTKVVNKYISLMEHLYNSGLRKFFLIKVPPTQRTPLMRNRGAAHVTNVGKAVTFYNNLLSQKALAWKNGHKDIKVVIVETTADFNEALDHPKKYGSQDNICTNSNGKTCLWHDSYHPGIQIHKLVGFKVKSALREIGLW